MSGISQAVDREFRTINDVFVTFDPEKLRGACAEPNRVKANFTLRLHSVELGSPFLHRMCIFNYLGTLQNPIENGVN